MDHQMDKRFGVRLRTIRERLHLTQEPRGRLGNLVEEVMSQLEVEGQDGRWVPKKEGGTVWT